MDQSTSQATVIADLASGTKPTITILRPWPEDAIECRVVDANAMESACRQDWVPVACFPIFRSQTGPGFGNRTLEEVWYGSAQWSLNFVIVRSSAVTFRKLQDEVSALESALTKAKLDRDETRRENDLAKEQLSVERQGRDLAIQARKALEDELKVLKSQWEEAQKAIDMVRLKLGELRYAELVSATVSPGQADGTRVFRERKSA